MPRLSWHLLMRDALHPAFSNLFVQTEIIRPQGAILCNRRPRTEEEAVPWMFHMMAVHGAETGEISYETDRAQFIGRGNTVANPQALEWKDEVDSGRLSDSGELCWIPLLLFAAPLL